MWVSSMCWIRSPKLGNVMPQPLNLHMLIKNTAIFQLVPSSRLARSNRPTEPLSLSLSLFPSHTRTHFYAASNRSLSLGLLRWCCADVVAPPTTQSRNSPSRGLLRHWLAGLALACAESKMDDRRRRRRSCHSSAKLALSLSHTLTGRAFVVSANGKMSPVLRF